MTGALTKGHCRDGSPVVWSPPRFARISLVIARDVAILICSRGREEDLSRLIGDLERGYLPALAAAGLSASVLVYGQGYPLAFQEELGRRFAPMVEDGRLLIVAAERSHSRIGDVVRTMVMAAHARLTYRLAMLMDDDSVYVPDRHIDENLRQAARRFLAENHRCYSIKLGAERTLRYSRFIEPEGPIMPFKEKMMWVSRAVLDEVLETPRFEELSIGEDAVMAAVAWLKEPEACFSVYGLATFLHLGYEPAPDLAHDDSKGGYAELMGYSGPDPALVHGKYDKALRTGVTPHHIMPDVFVGPEHEHFIYNGVRQEVVERRLPAPS